VGSAAFAFAVSWSAPSCSTFTAADAALLQGADVAACAGLSLIPVVGGFLGAACVGEEGAVKDALDHAVTTSAPDAGAPSPQPAPVASAGTRLGAPLTAMRGGRRKLVGHAPASFTPTMVAAAQAHLDAQAQR
jgi:hypothetical protein